MLALLNRLLADPAFSNALISLGVTAIVALATYLSVTLKRLLTPGYTELFGAVAQAAVRAAEQYGTAQGLDGQGKLLYALEYLSAEARSRGIVIPEPLLRGLIEQAVLELKARNLELSPNPTSSGTTLLAR